MNFTIKEPSILRKISNLNQEKRLIADTNTSHLTRWLKGNEVTIEKDKAIDYVGKNHKKNSRPYLKRLDFIINFEYYLTKYSRDGKDDRLHSLFTRLPSDLKKFVLAGGAPLVEIDITNSQPLFIVLLLKEIRIIHRDYITVSRSFKDIKKRVRGVLSSYINNRKKYLYYNDINRYKIDINNISINITTILLENSETLDFADISLFEKLVIEGRIYEHVGKILLEKKSIWREGTEYQVKLFNGEKKIQEIKKFSSLRKCVKTVMLNALYSPPKTKGLKAINDLKKGFPNLFFILDAIKGNNSNEFPIYLQRMEAKFILDICSKKIDNQYPEVILISRHDSLSTAEEYGDQLQRLVQEMFCEYLGFEVRVKKEYW